MALIDGLKTQILIVLSCNIAFGMACFCKMGYYICLTDEPVKDLFHILVISIYKLIF